MNQTNLAESKLPVGIYDVPNGNMNPPRIVKEMFERAGVSQRAFAHRMGLQEGTFSRYLSGRHKVPKLAAMGAIFAAMCFGVAVRIAKPAEQLTRAVKNPKT